VECDGLGLHFALLYVDLVATKNDGNVLTNTNEVTWAMSVNCQFEATGLPYDASLGRSCK